MKINSIEHTSATYFGRFQSQHFRKLNNNFPVLTARPSKKIIARLEIITSADGVVAHKAVTMLWIGRRNL